MSLRQLGVFRQIFNKVDEQSTRHGGELVAAVMKSHGVSTIFTLSGGHISPILTAAEKEGIRVIDTRHEVTTVFAADATSRLTGMPGVAVVTAGPGLTNVITALQNASLAESPLVLMCGCPSALLKNRGALQDIDQMSLVKSVTKWRSTVTKVRDIVPLVREAFRQAQAGTPGPVLLEFPLDTLYPSAVVQKEFVAAANPTTLKGKLINLYTTNYMKDLFADAFTVARETNPLPVDIPLPSQSQVQNAYDILKSAKRPLILFGSQSVLPPIGADKLADLVRKLNIPVYLGGMSRGLMGIGSKLHMRQARREALKEADVVIMAGTVADFRLNYGRVLPKGAKIIAINRSKQQLYKNSDMFWTPNLAVQADTGKFIQELVNLTEKHGLPNYDEWIAKLRARDNAKEKKTAAMADLSSNDEYLNPVKLLRDLDSALTDKTILVADGGDFVATASYIVRPRGPLTWLDPGAFGTLGVGGGFALGAKVARPDSDVVILFGDGSLGYSLMEFDTYVRHGINVTAVVGNDACWTQIAREQQPMLGSDVACNLSYSAYEQAVEKLGAKGFVLGGKGASTDIKACIQEALQINRGPNGKPVLINAKIGKTDFRKGSISV